VQRAHEIGATGWLSKPFKLSALLEILNACSSALHDAQSMTIH
jgi:hypothetical protein